MTSCAIDRENRWKFWAGAEIHELIDPEGTIFTMQSYAMMADPTLTIADLPSLATEFSPPPGWTYRARILDTDLILQANGQAHVIQDDLQNTYQRH